MALRRRREEKLKMQHVEEERKKNKTKQEKLNDPEPLNTQTLSGSIQRTFAGSMPNSGEW